MMGHIVVICDWLLGTQAFSEPEPARRLIYPVVMMLPREPYRVRDSHYSPLEKLLDLN